MKSQVNKIGFYKPKQGKLIKRPETINGKYPKYHLAFGLWFLYLKAKKVKLFEAKDAILVWNIKDGASLYNRNQKKIFDIKDQNNEVAFSPPQVNIKGKTLSLVRFRDSRNNYSHFMLERFPVLFYFQSFSELKNFDYYLIDKASEKVFRELAEILDLKGKPILAERDGSLHFEKLYFTYSLDHPLNNGDSFLIDKYNSLVKNIQIVPTDAKRIFITRARGRRGLINEDEVNALMLKYNFTLVDFETMSLKEQISYINNANIIVGVHGAGLTNLIFANHEKDISCIEIIPKACSTPAFYYLARVLGMHYYIVPPKEGWDKVQDMKTHQYDVDADTVILEKMIKRALNNHPKYRPRKNSCLNRINE